jgi:hypothetical protein
MRLQQREVDGEGKTTPDSMATSDDERGVSLGSHFPDGVAG